MHCLSLATAALLLAGCGSAPAGLPTQDKVKELEALDRETAPPLYQHLYDSAFLPDIQLAEQRARILIWLRYTGLDESQLRRMLHLHGRAATLRERLEISQQRIVQRYEPQLATTYDEIYTLLAQGAALDDPRFEAYSQQLLEDKLHRVRDSELLAIRMQSVRALLDEEQELLRTLSPHQEARFPDVVFCLRRELDMASNAGDFKVLVGSLYSVGDPTLLLRGDFEESREHLDIGGLWADDAETELSGPVLHQARRELLLYMLLQEPALPDAVGGALQALANGAAPPIATDSPAPPSPGSGMAQPPPGARPPPGAEPPPG